MSTKMTDTDWANALEVFRACLPRRGRKATNDRLFLEAMHFFTVENVRWRALPERFGHWNSVWKRFDRLSKAGVFMSVEWFTDSAFPAVWNSPHVKGACQDRMGIGKRLQKRILQHIDVYQFGSPMFANAFNEDHRVRLAFIIEGKRQRTRKQARFTRVSKRRTHRQAASCRQICDHV